MIVVRTTRDRGFEYTDTCGTMHTDTVISIDMSKGYKIMTIKESAIEDIKHQPFYGDQDE